MSELSTPDVFHSSPLFPAEVVSETVREDKRSDKLAKEFVRWCFGFGSDFRNTPDVINLRAWTQKTRVQLGNREEVELLNEARRIYLKRIGQMMKKADAPMLGAEQAADL